MGGFHKAKAPERASSASAGSPPPPTPTFWNHDQGGLPFMFAYSVGCWGRGKRWGPRASIISSSHRHAAHQPGGHTNSLTCLQANLHETENASASHTKEPVRLDQVTHVLPVNSCRLLHVTQPDSDCNRLTPDGSSEEPSQALHTRAFFLPFLDSLDSLSGTLSPGTMASCCSESAPCQGLCFHSPLPTALHCRPRSQAVDSHNSEI